MNCTWQRLREQATLIVTVLLTVMVGVLSLKMFDMNGAYLHAMGARAQSFCVGALSRLGAQRRLRSSGLPTSSRCERDRITWECLRPSWAATVRTGTCLPVAVWSVTPAPAGLATLAASNVPNEAFTDECGREFAGELTSYNVAQECICECNGTSTGIFCRGANPMRQFLAVASTEPDVEGWKMSMWSVDHGDPWRTTARFGNTYVPSPAVVDMCFDGFQTPQAWLFIA